LSRIPCTQVSFRSRLSGKIADQDKSTRRIYESSALQRDKSLEIYKFHINALYVAITRAVRNIYQLLSFDMIAHVHEEQNPYWGDHDFNKFRQEHIERFADMIKTYTEKGSWNEYF